MKRLKGRDVGGMSERQLHSLLYSEILRLGDRHTLGWSSREIDAAIDRASVYARELRSRGTQLTLLEQAEVHEFPAR